MATEDSPRSMTTRTAGGSPYLQSFIQPAEVAQTAQFERELQMAKEDRAQQSFDLSNAREARMDEESRIKEARLQHKEDRQTERQKFMDDWRMRQEERNAELDTLKFRHQEALENASLAEKRDETVAAEAIARISSLNPQKLSFGYDARSLMSEDKGLQSALIGKHGKAVKAALDERMESNSNLIKSYQQRAADAGYTGDVMGFADKAGMMDDIKFSQTIEAARTQKQIKEADAQAQRSAAMAARAKELGLVPIKLDPKTEQVTYGKPDAVDVLNAENKGGESTPKTSALPKAKPAVTLDDFPTKPENSPPVIP